MGTGKSLRYTIILLMTLLIAGNQTIAQDTTSAVSRTDTDKKKLAAVLIAEGGFYVLSLTGLYFAWYKDYPQSSFHLFDDNQEWLQMDKAGHMTTSYYVGRIGYESYRWAGVGEKTSAWAGGMLGFVYLLNVEILDGFSSGWGFSTGDLVANTAGAALFISQQLGWKEQRFTLKYSYHPTDYPALRPDLLGSSAVQRSLKDYNGQTYWLSGNISSFLPGESKFPKWLNVSLGYSAEGMTGAHVNTITGEVVNNPRYRQFYLSLDADLTRIHTRSKPLHYLFVVLNIVKIPFPAIEFNSLGQVRFYPFYF
ncbi:MAG: DUF2279 domain-containing protein [Syntrophothermus sp.]